MTKRREAIDLGRFVRHPAGFAAFRGNVFSVGQRRRYWRICRRA